MLMARSRTPARYASSKEFRNPKPQNSKFLQICARKCYLCARMCNPRRTGDSTKVLALLSEKLVPKKGLEPPHPCGYMDLNHARLPIPPRWPGYYSGASANWAEVGPTRRPQGSLQERTAFLFYRRIDLCQTNRAARRWHRASFSSPRVGSPVKPE